MPQRARPPRAGSAVPAPDFRADHQRDVIHRLRRIEGQVKALVDMIEAGRDCEDVAQQMAAARRAMDKAFHRMIACSIMEGLHRSQVPAEAAKRVEQATRILERFA